MQQEDKDLLLKDLCARSPYKVKCAVIGEKQPFTLTTIEVDYINGHLFNFLELRKGFVVQVYTSELKPYLFPLSSMTEEQKVIYGDLCYAVIHSLAWDMQAALNELVDWLNKNHFDYRNLIKKGLALDATGLNIY